MMMVGFAPPSLGLASTVGVALSVVPSGRKKDEQ